GRGRSSGSARRRRSSCTAGRRSTCSGPRVRSGGRSIRRCARGPSRSDPRSAWAATRRSRRCRGRPPGAPLYLRARGILLILLLVLVLLAVGLGLVELISLPFGGVGLGGGLLLGLLVVVAALGILALLGRRRQSRAVEQRAAGTRGR